MRHSGSLAFFNPTLLILRRFVNFCSPMSIGLEKLFGRSAEEFVDPHGWARELEGRGNTEHLSTRVEHAMMR